MIEKSITTVQLLLALSPTVVAINSKISLKIAQVLVSTSKKPNEIKADRFFKIMPATTR